MSRIRMKRARRIIVHSLILALFLVAATYAPAFADGPTNPNCWGKVTSQRASTVHDVGEHASNQAEPRAGLGNLARTLYELGITSGPHVSYMGSFLATVDDVEAKQCP